MPSTDVAERNQSRIAVSLQSSSNTRLIRRILGNGDAIAGEIALDETGQPAFDLAIVDPPALARFRAFLEHCRALVEPVALPVLVVVEDHGSEAGGGAWELGVAADDVVRIPTTEEELVARVGNLLRLRTLSHALQDRYERVDHALQGTNRTLRTLHVGNEVLVRAGNEEELLDQICRVIIESEDYALAWSGFLRDGDDPEITIDAIAGEKAGYGEVIRLPRSRVAGAPAWRAMETGEVVVLEDLLREPALQAFRAPMQAWGLASVITLPLRPESGAPGVLAIYSGTRGNFHDDEREILMRLAANIEFRLNALRIGEERDRQKEAIRDLAFRDPLTGLHNRNSAAERLDTLLSGDRAEQEAGVLFIDLNRFKIINDALGHAAGDRVLQQVGQRLQQAIRPGDLVARQGGDEFIVVMAEPPRSTGERGLALGADGIKDAAWSLAERIAASLNEPLVVDGAEHRLDASIGVSLYPEHATTAHELIDYADAAMYASKKTEGHVCTYSDPTPGQEFRHRYGEQWLSIDHRAHDAAIPGKHRPAYPRRGNRDELAAPEAARKSLFRRP